MYNRKMIKEIVASKKYRDRQEYDVTSLDGKHSHLSAGVRKMNPADPLRFFVRLGDVLVWLHRTEPQPSERTAFEFKLDNLESLLYLSHIKSHCRQASPTAHLSVDQFNTAFSALGLGFSYNSIADRVVLMDIHLTHAEYTTLTHLINQNFPL